LGDPAGAVPDFDRAIQLAPSYAEAYSNRGEARRALGDFTGAIADFDRALALVPQHGSPLIYHNRGAAYQAQGAHAQALADFDRALAINPVHAPTYNNRGSARHALGDLQGALADFDRALELTPASASASIYHNRGGVRVTLGDLKGAIADYNTALDLDPQLYVAYISRANARFHRRDPESFRDYLRAFAIHPESASREIVRILASDLQRDPEAVLKNCQKHLRINPSDVIAMARRGLTLFLKGRAQEAEADFSAIASLCPDIELPLRLSRDEMVRQSNQVAPKFKTPEGSQIQERSWTCET
jgi:tetratricopeptide (TPR) repeat protein